VVDEGGEAGGDCGEEMVGWQRERVGNEEVERFLMIGFRK